MAMFDERDKDHDGLLSFEEFSGQETKMERAFKSMDKDGDGFITKAEFKLVCKNLTKGIVKLILYMFLNKSNNYRASNKKSYQNKKLLELEIDSELISYEEKLVY